MVGDFNIVPSETDAHSFSSEDILCSDKEREALDGIIKLGLRDCYTKDDKLSPYTWWDYRSGAFHRDIGYELICYWQVISYIKISKTIVFIEKQGISHGAKSNQKHLTMPSHGYKSKINLD